MKILLLFTLLLLTTAVTAQVKPATVRTVTDKRAQELLGTLDTLFIRRANNLFIRVFLRQTGPVSLPETHGVAHEILISVSEYGENEPYKVFAIGPFIGPVFGKAGDDLKNRYVLTFTEGAEKRRTRALDIYLDKVVLR